MGIGREDYEERKAARIEGMRERAEKKRAEGAGRLGKAKAIAGMIPMGQPILVGHHSERRHRKDIARIDAGFTKGFELMSEAEDLERRAEKAEKSEAISSDDPAAVVKLRGELEEARGHLARWKAVRDALKSCKAERLEALELTAREKQTIEIMCSRMEPERKYKGITFTVTNAGANVKRIEKRIADLEAKAAEAPKADLEIGECLISESDNRVRMVFPGKPSEEIRTELKRHGFKWAPSAGAWQRMANATAWFWAERIARKMAGE